MSESNRPIVNPLLDPAVLNSFTVQQRERIIDLVWNESTSRQQWMQKFIDPRRNIYEECGYPPTIDKKKYKFYYDRHPIARRVVEMLPKECFQAAPSVYESEDPNVKTEFEKAFDALGKSLNGRSWHADTEGNAFWGIMQRADIKSRIGQFGIILIGINDKQRLDMPAAMLADEDEDDEQSPVAVAAADSVSQPTDGTDAQYGPIYMGPEQKPPVLEKGARQRLLFLEVFDQSLVEITRFESNPMSPRFGMPLMYRVTFNDPSQTQESGVGLTNSTMDVHWTRIVHLAEDLESSKWAATPAMQPVWNPLQDLEKIYGGGAEGTWQTCVPWVSFETHPQLGGDVRVDGQQTKDAFENVVNGLQRSITTSGMTAKIQAPAIGDTTPQIATLIEAICIELGSPVRVFKGSERGELASSQDDSSWNDRLKNRQNNYLTPKVICPTIDRLIALGILPVPEAKQSVKGQTSETGNGEATTVPSVTTNAGFAPMPAPEEDNTDTSTLDAQPEESTGGYKVVWPDLDSTSQTQKAQIALQLTQAIVAFISGNGEAGMTLHDFYSILLKFTDEEAAGIVKRAMKQAGAPQGERLTPDPEEAQQQQMQMQADALEQTQAHEAESQDKEIGFKEKALKAKPPAIKKAPTTNKAQPAVYKQTVALADGVYYGDWEGKKVKITDMTANKRVEFDLDTRSPTRQSVVVDVVNNVASVHVEE